MELKKSKYHFFDFVAIPLRAAPLNCVLRIVFLFLSALWPAVQVLVTAMFVDRAVAIFNGTMETERIYLPLLATLLMILYLNIEGVILDFLKLKFDIQLLEKFRLALVEKRARLEYRHVESNDAWELVNRVCEKPSDRISGGFANLLRALSIVVTVLSLLSIITVQVWWAGLAILGFSVPLFMLAIKSGQNSYEANKEAKKHERRASYLLGVITGRENVEERALFSYTHHLNQKWYEKYEISRKINQKVQAVNFVKMKGGGILTLFISVGIIAILVFPLERGAITVGMFVALVTATFNLVQNLSWSLVHITSELADSREFLKDLSAFCVLSEQEGAVELPEALDSFVFNSIEFKNVTFTYPGTDRTILKDFSLQLKAGRHYAFVGVNGAGKTTLTKLLCGLYDQYEGEILINGKNLRSYALTQLKSLFSVAYQDFAKYYISFRDNIALGDLSRAHDDQLQVDEGRMLEAIKTIELDEAVAKLPEGTDTILGKIKENGTDLSGGEWQRVAIARSLYSKAQVRILDEPTAALDPVAESQVYKLFGQISKGKTTIFITHRLGAARLADEIIVLDEGHVAEKGSHEELMTKDGLYASMFSSQRSWYQ